MKKLDEKTSGLLLVACSLIIFVMIIVMLGISTHNHSAEYCYDTTNIIKSYESILLQNKELKKKIRNIELEYERFVREYFIIEATLTAYTARREETNNDPENTALMQEPVSGWTVAVSRDLIHLLGKRIYIEGIGVRYVNDLMNPRFKNTIDILMPNVRTAREFGVKRGVRVVLITEQ